MREGRKECRKTDHYQLVPLWLFLFAHALWFMHVSVKLTISVDTTCPPCMGPLAVSWGQWTNGTWLLATDGTGDRADRPINTRPHPTRGAPDLCGSAFPLEPGPLTLIPRTIIGNAAGESIGPSHLRVILMI